MKKALLAALAIVLTSAATLLLWEGVYSIAKGRKPHLSLSYQALARAGLAGRAAHDAEGAYAPWFSEAGELSSLLAPIREAAVGVGNSPFDEVVTEAAAINTSVDGCPALKPDQRKIAFHLRSNAFNPFDPITIFYDAGQQLDPRLVEFFDRYGARRVHMTTTHAGERATFPLIERARKVLVAGDSVAFGAMIDDSETIAAELQRRDRSRQYLNLGVAGIDAAASVCRLDDAARRYKDQIDALIYVYCENDFQPDRPYGKPQEMVDWLAGFARREGIGEVTVVFSPYIYLIAPELTRFAGYFGATYPQRTRERLELEQAAKAAGFRWADIGALAKAEEESARNQFAIFGLFVDHNHLSPYGVGKLADALLAR
jgi:hypothetical protein